MKRRVLILAVMTCAMTTGSFARGADDESLGARVKRFFAGPTPRPHKKHRKKSSPTPTPSESPSPTASVLPTITVTPTPSVFPSATLSPEPSATLSPPPPMPAPSSSQTPSAAVSPSAYPAQSPRSHPHAPMIEVIRPISPSPRHQSIQSPPPSVTIPSPGQPRPTPLEGVPVPGAQPNPPAPPPPAVSPITSASPNAAPAATPQAKRKPAAPATISANEIAGYETYSPAVRKLLDLALGLTTQNLGYKYGSADPANGGMDCSGFIHYVLSKSGVNDPPRDAREQYTWVRKAGTFQAVLAHRDDSFELDGLMPGDLLFWSGTYFVDRDPAITHTMIYLGRAKGTNQRIMVGSSDGRIYKGQQRLGVSVFDFKISSPKAKTDDRSSPVFVGYARIPALPHE